MPFARRASSALTVAVTLRHLMLSFAVDRYFDDGFGSCDGFVALQDDDSIVIQIEGLVILVKELERQQMEGAFGGFVLIAFFFPILNEVEDFAGHNPCL